MTVAGTVRLWHDEDGWGVVDSPATPGGCWVHYSAVLVAGYRTLAAGQAAVMEVEAVEQDGWRWRAVRAWPADAEPVEMIEPDRGSSGFGSSVEISYDEDPRRP